MTRLSPIISSVANLQSENKGSTYGQAFCSSNSHSFQESSGNGGLDNQNGTKVFYVKATLCSPYSSCIIKAYVFTRDSRTT